MKKMMLTIGIALVILMSCIALTGCTNHEATPGELVAEAYLIKTHGGGDYKIDIAKVTDEKVYFYWDNCEGHSGYTHCDVVW